MMLVPAQSGMVVGTDWQGSYKANRLLSEQGLGTAPVMQLFAFLASPGGHSDKVRGQILCFYALASQESLDSNMHINKLNLDVLQKHLKGNGDKRKL